VKEVGRKVIKDHTLTCMQANVRSILNKYKREELELMVIENRVDILGITESWMHDGVNDAEVSMMGYRLFRKDREKNSEAGKGRGGGVLLYIRDDLTAVDVSSEKDKKNESLWVKINEEGGEDDSVVIGVCYRSPASSKEESNSIMNSITEQVAKARCIVMGDFNYADIDWKLWQAGSLGRDFMDRAHDLFLTQHVEEGTRGGNVLDLVFSTEPDMVEDVKVLSPVANSDHNTVLWEVTLRTEVEERKQVAYDYGRGEYRKVIEEMRGVDWEKEFEGKDVKKMWTFFLKRLLGCREKYVPKRKDKKRVRPRWMRKGIAKLIKKRKRKWEKYIEWPTVSARMDYNKVRNKVTSEIRRTKKNFEQKLAEEIRDNPKLFYSYVRSKSKTKVKVGPLKNSDGSIVGDSRGMSKVLNDYFATVFTDENMDNMPEPSGREREGKKSSIEWIEMTEKKVEMAIGELKANKAAGVDELESNYIKSCSEGLTRPLKILFEKSLREGEIPHEWKEANVAAIFKEGDKKNPANYRPVSLTSQVGKVLEKVIKKELVSYLEENGLIGKTQHGFRKGRSCLTNLLEFFEVVAGEVDRGEPVDVLYFDFRKAFDRVPHERLLLKLKALGIEGRILGWIREWLTERRQRVVVGGEYSEWTKVTSGVPQGSVLGPMLFLIFINDIDEEIKTRIWKFADDLKMMGRVKTKEDIEQIRKDIDKLVEWSEDWQLSFNPDKCKVMHIGSKNEGQRYVMDGKELKAVKEEKDLGVIVTDDFKVGRQCAEAAKKGNRVLGMIKRTFTCKSKFIVKKLFKSLVRPHLDSCVQAWRPHLKKDIEVLEKVQRRATKMVDGYRGIEYEERLKRIGLTTLEVRRERADLLEVFKILKGMEGLDRDQFFSDAGNVGGKGMKTRGHHMKLYKKGVRLEAGKFSFGNRVVGMWNSLPREVVEQDTVNKFKGKLDKFLRNMKGTL
jgi:ribonucleases P/MRP protein subunit RPP40